MTSVLVIDDDEMVRSTLRDILELGGYEVVEAGDGRQGVRLFEASPTDLVITDILMPEQEGVETIIKLRRMFPEIRIIAISGGGATGNLNFLEVAKKLGAAQVLAKPFGTDELLHAVQGVMARS